MKKIIEIPDGAKGGKISFNCEKSRGGGLPFRAWGTMDIDDLPDAPENKKPTIYDHIKDMFSTEVTCLECGGKFTVDDEFIHTNKGVIHLKCYPKPLIKDTE